MVRGSARGCALVLILAACGGATVSPSTITTGGSPSAASVPGGPMPMPAGQLTSGTTYVFPDFEGLALTTPEGAWSAGLLNGGDVQISSTSVAIYFILPATIVSSDGTARRDWPTDPEMAKAQLEAAPGVTIAATEPITIAGVQTELISVTARGGSAEAPLIQSGSGEWGFTDGENAVVLLPVGDRLMFVTYEVRADTEAASMSVLEGLAFLD